MAQVEADALYQAQKIGVFGVHRRYLDRIQKAAAFNLESRPHASIPGSVPVGEPKEHANLARTAERLLAVSEQLKTAANGQLRALKAGSQGSEIVTAWLKGKKTGYERLSMIERSRKVISDYSDELKNNNGRSECQCMVCRKIADNLRWSEKVERDTGAVSGYVAAVNVLTPLIVACRFSQRSRTPSRRPSIAKLGATKTSQCHRHRLRAARVYPTPLVEVLRRQTEAGAAAATSSKPSYYSVKGSLLHAASGRESTKTRSEDSKTSN